MSLLNKLLRNIFSNWAGMAVGLIISFILAPIVVHGLGDTYYGIWVIMMQLTGYMWLFDLGIRESVIRYVSKHHTDKNSDELNKIVSTAFYLYLFIGVITIAITFVLAYYFPHIFEIKKEAIDIARIVLIITGINVAQGWLFNTYVGILMGLQRYDIFNKIGIAFGILRFIVIVIFLHLGYGIIALGIIQLCINFLSNILMYFYCKREIHDLKIIPFNKKHMQHKLILNYSVFVLINNVGQKIVFFTDALVIGIFLPVNAITYYAIPGNLINYMRNIVTAMTRVFNPLISELETKNENEKIKLIFLKGTKFSIIIGLPIGITYLFLGKLFISLWMGNEYALASSGVIFVLSIAHSFSLVHYTIDNVLYGISKHNIIAYLRISEAIVNLILSIILVKTMGIVGVAIGTAIPHIIFMVIVLPILVCRLVELPVSKYLKSAIVPSTTAILPYAFGCYILNQYFPSESMAMFFLKILAIFPLYLISIWFIALDNDEKSYFEDTIFPILLFWNKRKK